MAADTLSPTTPTILNYINQGSYPENEDIASATIDPSDLASLLHSLRSARDEVKDSIRSVSRSTAPDIDTWISRARELQDDILRSRDAAREIVKEAEASENLKAQVQDTAAKVELLEKEVGFNETLTGTLEHVHYANGLLAKAQEEAVKGDVERALRKLEDAEASIAGLGGVKGSRAVEVLDQRAEQLRRGLVESATECWNALINVDVEGMKIRVQREGLKTAVPEAAVPEISLDAIVAAVQGLDVFDWLIQKLARDVDRAILRPMIVLDRNDQVYGLTASESEISCSAKISDLKANALLENINSLLSFLSTSLPSSTLESLSANLVPKLVDRLETNWLDPSIPVDISGMTDFQSLLKSVSSLADNIEALRWSGAERLREWVENAPRSWLTKRREAVLGEVRDLVFAGLKERKTAERVETRTLKKDDVGLSQLEQTEGDDDAWDDAWEEDEQPKSSPSRKDDIEDEDMDTSAWDVDDDDEKPDIPNQTSADGDEDDAWGWGDEDMGSQKQPSPVTPKKQPVKLSAPPNGTSNEEELTLRETFTTTGIPSGILSILQNSVTDAQTLSGPDFASSPIVPASSALYTIPALALAIYRATAPTAYAKDKDGLGGMLIYNDASWLADQLRSWKASQPAGSKLRVDADVTALEQFAKKAYSTEMESQRTILNDLLDGAQGFGNCTAQPFKQECEGAVDATVDWIRTLRGMWEGVLSQGALLQSLGSLLSTITRKIMSEIMDFDDIGEAESQQLKALCDRVTALKSLFVQSSPQGEEQDMTFIYCPTWLRFQYLAEILESSLADIKWMWKEGELSLEFGAEHVVGLIEALFAESNLRREAVREIRQGR